MEPESDNPLGGSEAEHSEEPKKTEKPITSILVVMLLCLTANSVMPFLLWDVSGGIELQFGFFCSGGLAAQIAVLSVWAAIGSGSLKWRLPSCVLGSLIVGGSFVFGLSLPEGYIPAYVAVVLLCISVAGLLLGFAAFIGMSRWTHERIVRGNYQEQVGTQSFSIGYLIVSTSMVALGIAIIKYLVTSSSDTETLPNTSKFIEVSVVVTQYVVFSGLLMTSCLPLVLKPKFRFEYIVLLVMVFAILLPANLFLLSQYLSLRFEDVKASVAFSFGYLLISILLLLVVRQNGFRLVKRA